MTLKNAARLALVGRGLLTILLAAHFILDLLNANQQGARIKRWSVRHDPIQIHERHGNQVTSPNWSGYAVTGANGSVTGVKGSWKVPPVYCGTTSNAYASFWVGIDGYSSNTVEQIGTDSDCQNGSPVYYAWFEFYPQASFSVNSLRITAGDVISAEVTYASERFTVSLTDETTHQSFSTSTKMNSTKRSSAEWVIEARSDGRVLPLADFRAVLYGADYTSVASTCYATVGGRSGSIGSFGGSVYDILMESRNGTWKSRPSALSTDGSSFMEAWLGAGP